MDPFATKGIEYLLIFGYLSLLVPFWLCMSWMARQQQPAVALGTSASRAPTPRPWFEVPEEFHFHRGHTWARPEEGGVLRVGMDDFAQRLLGEPSALLMPGVGDYVAQGERGWQLRVDGHDVDLLSPLNGEVVAVNQDAIRDPELVCEDPYGGGWLIKVRAKNPKAALKNLLPPALAQAWMDESVGQLVGLMQGELDPVLQDGGIPVRGFARQLGGDRWPEVAAQLLMTHESVERMDSPDTRERS